MRLEQLHVSRDAYGETKGQLRGRVEFTGSYGKVELALDEELSLRIVRICADAIVAASREVAEKMTAEVIEGSVPQLTGEP
jgi:hypothetical protein